MRPIAHLWIGFRNPARTAATLFAVTAMMVALFSISTAATADKDLANTSPPSMIQNTTKTSDPLANLPAKARQSIKSQMKAIQYQVRKTDTSEITPYTAANPANAYGVSFEKDQVRVNSASKATAGWDLTMRLAAFGYEGRMQPVAPATLHTRGNRLTYKRGNIEEWYVNTPSGVEQGFTLARAPGIQGSAELQFKIAVGGGLTPRMAADGANIDLMNDQGKRVLTYRKLVVTDATGKVLPAEMKPVVSAKRDAILIAVNDAGAAYPLTVDPVLHAPKLIANGGAADDFFGVSVAISGDTVVVGAHGDDDNGDRSGSAYIFERDQGGTDAWGQVAKITAADGAAWDEFGHSVAIDADTVVVGAYGDTDNGPLSGSVYLFYRDRGGADAWGQVAKITASDGAASDGFGWSVAIDADTVVVGARADDDNGIVSGSAYIFERDQGGVDAWGQVTKITAADGAAWDDFGWFVAIDADTVVVGAYGDDDNGSRSGSAYIFDRDQGGADAWGQATKITADDGEADDNFGRSVTISGDTVVVGAWGDDDNGSGSGSAYIFYRDQGGIDVWGQVAKITAADGAAGDQFGHSVAIDADTVVVGAYGDQDNGSDSGSAYIFDRNQGGADAWGQVAKITAADGAANDYFGYSVAIDGDTVVAGAPSDDDNGSGSGSTYIMDGLPGVTVSPTTGLTTTEAGGTATFTMVLDSNPYGYALIDLSSGDEGECTVSPEYLIFSSTDWNSAQTVTVTGVDDQAEDGDQACTVMMSSVQIDGSLYDGVTVPDVPVTNQDDDDSAGVLVSPTSGLTTTEMGGMAIFNVSLTSQPLADVSIDLTSSDPDEGSVSPDQLVFTPTNWNQKLAVLVTGEDDAAQDGNIDYTIVTAAAQSSDGAYDGLDPSDVTVTNMDDDIAAVLVSPTSGLTTTETGGSATFTVVLATMPAANVTIDLTSGNSDEGTVSPASITFTPSDWDTSQTVTVTGVDDSIVDGQQAYAITTGACVSSDPVYNGMDPANVSVSNMDDDSASVLVSPTSGLTTTETGDSATFTVVLSTQPAGDVTIDLNSSNTAEGTVAPASLTFTSSDWDTAQTVTVTGVDDGLEDGDQAYTITTSTCVSSDPQYSGMDPADVSVTNTDDGGTGTGSSGGGGSSGCFIDALMLK